MRILVCGSRGWESVWQVRMVYAELDKAKPTEIISGGARGADRVAEVWAKTNSVPITVFTPDWNKYGRRAGVLRNNQMLDKKPDLVLAFWDGLSKGTKHTIDEARRRNIRVEVIRAGLEGRSDSADRADN
jgi:hypothetical protein